MPNEPNDERSVARDDEESYTAGKQKEKLPTNYFTAGLELPTEVIALIIYSSMKKLKRA